MRPSRFQCPENRLERSAGVRVKFDGLSRPEGNAIKSFVEENPG
jgi:hypothetical protein